MSYPMRLSTQLRGLGHYWSDRRQFASMAAWLRGLRLMASWHLLRRRAGSTAPGRAVGLRLAGSPQSLWVRPGTSDFEVVREILFRGQYDAALRRLQPGALVLDLGANIGVSVRLWQRAGAGQIVAVEPDADNCAMISRNLLQPHEERVKIVRAGAASHDGQGILDRSGGAWGIKTRHSDAGSGTTSLLSIPSILSVAGVASERPIDLLKCDIEGFEAELFSSETAGAWLPRVRLLAIETHHPYSPERLLADVERNGLRAELLERRDAGPQAQLTLRIGRG